MALNNFLRRDAMIAGVAGGLAHSLDIPVLAVRLGLFISFFMSFGLSLLCYIAAIFAFPTDVYFNKFGDGPKALGVCYKLAPRIGISPGWLRFFTLLASLVTGFFPVPVIYLVVHLILNETKNGKSPSNGGTFRDLN